MWLPNKLYLQFNQFPYLLWGILDFLEEEFKDDKNKQNAKQVTNLETVPRKFNKHSYGRYPVFLYFFDANLIN